MTSSRILAQHAAELPEFPEEVDSRKRLHFRSRPGQSGFRSAAFPATSRLAAQVETKPSPEQLMNPNPLRTRETLARLHKRTQRFWTWLTGLTHRDEAPRPPWTVNQHMATFLSVATAAIGLAAWSAQTLYEATGAALF